MEYPGIKIVLHVTIQAEFLYFVFCKQKPLPDKIFAIHKQS